MSKELGPKSTPEYPIDEYTLQLYRICQTSYFTQQLKEDSRAIINADGLDVIFKRDKDILGLDAFGFPNCIGVKILRHPDQELRDTKYPNPDIDHALYQGAQVAKLSPRRLAQWEAFYKYLDEHNLLSKIGPRVRHASGLREATELNIESYLTRWGVLNSNYQTQFRQMGISRIGPQGQLDYAFIRSNNNIHPISLHHILQPLPEALGTPVLGEYVVKGPVMVPGFVLRRAGETKRETYERAKAIKDELIRSQGRRFTRDIMVPILSGGQLSLFEKMGLFSELASKSATDLSAEALIRFLYLGNDTLHPGSLAKLGLSLPGEDKVFGADIVFYRKNPTNPTGYEYTLVDGFLSAQWRANRLHFVPTNQVGGVIILPDNIDPQKGKENAERVIRDFRRRTQIGGANIAVVTPALFKIIQEKQSPFGTQEIIASIADPSFYGGVQENGNRLQLHVYQSNPQIGGNKILFRSGDKLFINDWGTDFDGSTSKALRALTAKPPSALGIFRQLETGEIPMVPGVYDSEYLIQSMREVNSLSKQSSDSVAGFIMADLALRAKTDDEVHFKMQKVLGRDKTDQIMVLGIEGAAGRWGGINFTLKSVFPTHAHVDHIGNVPLLDAEAPIIASAETIAHILAVAAKAGSWQQKSTAVSMITDFKRGKPYELKPREMIPVYKSGNTVVVKDDLTVTFYLTNHSITGSAMVGLSKNNQGVLLNTGDIRMDENGMTQKALSQASGKYPTIIIETTNPDDGNNHDKITEPQVRDNLITLLKDKKRTPGLIVAIIPPNQLERLHNLHIACEQSNKAMIISPEHAEIVQQMRASFQVAPNDSDGFQFWLPEIGQDAGLWLKPHTDLKQFQNDLVYKAKSGTLGMFDSSRLSILNQNDYVLVLSPFELLINNLSTINFPRTPAFIHSSPYPHKIDQQSIVRENWRWIGSRDAQIHADFALERGYFKSKVNPIGLHASGHASFGQMFEIIKVLCADDYRGKTLILMHGQHPKSYADALIQKMGTAVKDLRIISRMPRYDPKDPKNTHFVLRLET